MTTSVLAADIGGTKTLLSLYSLREDRLEPHATHRYLSADWADLASMVRHFLRQHLSRELQAPAVACFAVAGPVQAGRACLTNLDWQLSESELSRACGIARVELVNDFAVMVFGLPHLRPHQQASLRAGSPVDQEPLLIVGAGTGLGVTMGIRTATGLKAVASEAAHGEFAPRSQAEWELKQWLRLYLQLERVSIERVVSGTGLGNVALWMLSQRDPQKCHPLRFARDLPAAVAAAAAQGDQLAIDSLDLWLSAYGSVVGDLALACLSRGGIWLAGGTAGKLLEPLRSPAFQQAFLAKGRLRPVLETMPIQALIDPEIGSFSAACRARELLG